MTDYYSEAYTKVEINMTTILSGEARSIVLYDIETEPRNLIHILHLDPNYESYDDPELSSSLRYYYGNYNHYTLLTASFNLDNFTYQGEELTSPFLTQANEEMYVTYYNEQYRMLYFSID